LVETAQLISQYLTRFLYNARIAHVMARTRPDLGSNRLGLEEDLKLVLLVKLV
jgi:hypothetical protein